MNHCELRAGISQLQFFAGQLQQGCYCELRAGISQLQYGQSGDQ